MLIPKKNFVRNKAWRKYLSTLPCYLCGVFGYSQAAHIGKGGRGIKGHDSECLPLCGPRVNEMGCHAKLDQHRIEADKETMKQDGRKAYAQWTQGLIDQSMHTLQAYKEAVR